MSIDVLVIGGGFGGLFVAGELQRRGLDALVVDREDLPGGVCASRIVDGQVLEPAAGTFLLPHPHLDRALSGVDVVPAAPAAARRFIYTRGRLVGVEPSPKAIVSPVLPFGAKLRMAAEPFVRSGDDDDETLAGFFERRLGRPGGRLVATLAARGVFAGDPDRLSASAAFPALVGLERSAGSLVRGALRRLRARPKGAGRPGSHLPATTMADVAQELAARLGDGWRGGFPIVTVHRTDDGRWRAEGPEPLTARHVVLAVTPERAQALLGDPDPVPFPAAPVAVVWLGGDLDRLPLPAGFGYLAGPDTDLIGLGCLFESSYAPSRVPRGRNLVKVIVGGAAHPEAMQIGDDALVDRIAVEVSKVLGTEVEPDFSQVIRHLPGIPQYDVGHTARLRELQRRWPPGSGVHLAGWGYRGIGIGHLATDAHRLSERIAEVGR